METPRKFITAELSIRKRGRCFYQSELLHASESIDQDQFAYKKGLNSTMVLIKCQYTWLKWLDNDATYIRVFSFDFRKAFDNVPHDILCLKLKSLSINPYIVNWIINSFQIDNKG